MGSEASKNTPREGKINVLKKTLRKYFEFFFTDSEKSIQ